MFRKRNFFFLAALILALAFLLAAPHASAHPEEDCHFWFGLGFSHTMQEDESLCFYSNFFSATPGLVNNFIQGSDIRVSILDAGGHQVVHSEPGEWGAIQKVDPGIFGLDCPMPTIAITRWEYSPEALSLDPGTYTVWFDTIVERPIVNGLHMCGGPPTGRPGFSMVEDSVSFPVLLTVEPAS